MPTHELRLIPDATLSIGLTFNADSAREQTLCVEPLGVMDNRCADLHTSEMVRPVPAASMVMDILRFLAAQAEPVAAQTIAANISVPRTSIYPVLAVMKESNFVIHYVEEHVWGIGPAAWEVGIGFARQAPLARIARSPIAQLADAVGQTAQLAVLFGSDILYVVQERSAGSPYLVANVGARLPSHATASGRAILSTLPREQVKALYPSAAHFTDRTGRSPKNPMELKAALAEIRAVGHAMEDGEVTIGYASLAVPLGSPVVHASVSATWRAGTSIDTEWVLAHLRVTASLLTRRLQGGLKPSSTYLRPHRQHPDRSRLERRSKR